MDAFNWDRERLSATAQHHLTSSNFLHLPFISQPLQRRNLVKCLNTFNSLRWELSGSEISQLILLGEGNYSDLSWSGSHSLICDLEPAIEMSLLYLNCKISINFSVNILFHLWFAACHMKQTSLQIERSSVRMSETRIPISTYYLGRKMACLNVATVRLTIQKI